MMRSRTGRRTGRAPVPRIALPIAVLGALATAAVLATAGASVAASGGTTCSGTSVKSAGVLTGNITGNVTVAGFCEVNAGNATVHGSLTVASGAIAAFFARDDKTHSGTSNLTVTGNVIVDSGAVAILGCKASSSPCKDDSQKHPTLSNKITIGGNVVSTGALGVILHSTKVGGHISWTGGGGGESCKPVGVFKTSGSPPFYDMEDGSVAGSMTIKNIKGCWLGVLRDHIGKSLTIIGNKMGDPDAMEIGDNVIGGNLACTRNTMVWDTAETGNGLYPRQFKPNKVHGKRSGQCVRSTATTKGGPTGQHPF